MEQETTSRYRTLCEEHAIGWHLGANVFGLSDEAHNGILDTVRRFNAGEIGPDDEIKEGAGVTVAQMFEDLQIDWEEI